MKQLGATELAILRGFVRDVLRTCELDETEACMDLYDPALQCAEILEIIEVPYDEDYEEDESNWEHGHNYESDTE